MKRHYRTLTLDEFIQGQLTASQRRVSGMIFDDWIKSFGGDHVYVYPYSKDFFSDGKIEYSFLDALGINTIDWPFYQVTGSVVNASYSSAVLEVKRLLNYILSEQNSSVSNRVDWCLQGYSDANHEKRPPIHQFFGDTSWRVLTAKFQATNEYLKANVLQVNHENFLCYSDYIGPLGVASLSFSAIKSVVDEALKKDEVTFQELCSLYSTKKFQSFSSDLITLGHLLDQPVDRFTIDRTGFTDDELELLLSDNPKFIDFYIKQGLLLERLGNFTQAKKFIAKAQERRPGGEYLREIAARIDAKC